MNNSLYLLLTITLIACNPNSEFDSFTIEGKIEGISTGVAILEYSSHKDTSEIKNGQFHFNGSLQKPELCEIIIPADKISLKFYLENSEISIVGDINSFEKAQIKGSKTEAERIVYNKIINDFDKRFADIEREYETADEKQKVELEKLYNITDLGLLEAQRQFVKDNPSSYLCIGIIGEIDWSFNSGKEYNQYIALLDTSLNKYEDLLSLKEHATRLENVDVGKIAPDFEISDLDGEMVRLSDKYSNSKYLLLDFWASTCGPCRIENKHILEAYKKYHDKGFDVLGVSTDTKKELWLMAIEKDGLLWTNTCNLKKWNENELVREYALRQVSANFLIDNTGNIIASELRGDDLHSKLHELFNGSEF